MENKIKQFRRYLDEVSLLDRAELIKLLNFIEKRWRSDLPFDKKLEKFEQALSKALDKVVAKKAQLPSFTFPEVLPICQRVDEISAAIEKHQVVVLAGETGSGKTTQLPKICLALGRGVRGMIGHTQPRRIAARTVASRIAEETQSVLGQQIGYQVRFTDHSSDNTFVKLMTDGILLAEIQYDPLLLKYDTLIIDEAHERSLNIDFLLGYLKNILPKRPDLKLIITSATIDLERFSSHFNRAPVVEVSGRTYPVETRYRPWQDVYEDINECIVATLNDIMAESSRGDILVFLSGERDIRELSHAIKKADIRHLDVLPLYARLSLAEQNKVFQHHRGRRVVLSTNVAETSITVPGITHVIDPGYARISRYSVRTKVQRLPIEAISQASANQRQGRCGRVSNGICYRLYSEEDFLQRPEFTDAEILRTNLAAVILQMLQMNIGDVRSFPFVDPPDSRLINDGYKLLEEINAVSVGGKVTRIGRSIQNLPVDPRLARVVVEASKLGCLHEALIIVSALSLPDPRDRPADKQQAADEKHRRFWDDNSDFSAYVNLWDYLEKERQDLSQNQFRKLCQREYINYLRVKEWRELHHQLKLAVKSLEFTVNKEPANYTAIHQALLCGFLSNIGIRDQENKSREYFGTRQKKFLVFPGSSQAKKKHKWIMAAQFMETSQLFAHYSARIDPEWVLSYADHLTKKNYFEPHYNVKTGQVCTFVKTTLFGLVLEEKRRVGYSKIDPDEASNIFVRAALVEGAYRGKGAFFTSNQDTIAQVQDMEAKSRRRDIMVDDEVIYNFYRQLVPNTITNLAGFEHWRKAQEKNDEHVLLLSQELLLRRDTSDVSEQQFPDQLRLGDYSVPVSYRFEPGHLSDGVNIQVPLEILHEIPEFLLEWVVPGLLREKCSLLVKSLPKAVRKNFVPVPQYVDKVLPRLRPENNKLTESLGRALSHISSTTISKEQWDEGALDDFYRINIQLVDEHGKLIDQSRDIQALRKTHRARVQQTIAAVGNEVEREGISSWDFGDFANVVELDRGAVKIKAYPALIHQRDCVDLKVLDNATEAAFYSKIGFARLASLQCGQTVKYLRKQLLKGKDLGLTVVKLGKKDEVVDELILAAVYDAVFEDNDLPTTEAGFTQAIERGRAEIVTVAERYESALVESLAKVVTIKKRIKTHKNPLMIALAVTDIAAQIDNLLYKGCFMETPLAWLEHVPRYLTAIEHRLEKIPQNPSRDSGWSNDLSDLWALHEQRLAAEGRWGFVQNTHWQQYRWMLEELRVSFFAQSLKTLMPVSLKRLKKQWDASFPSS